MDVDGDSSPCRYVVTMLMVALALPLFFSRCFVGFVFVPLNRWMNNHAAILGHADGSQLLWMGQQTDATFGTTAPAMSSLQGGNTPLSDDLDDPPCC